MGNGGEALENQGTLESKTNSFDFLGLFCVETRPSESIVQNSNEIADVILQRGPLPTRPMEKVEDL